MGRKSRAAQEFGFRPFEKLKRRMERSAPDPLPRPAPPPPETGETPDEFTAAMQDVKMIAEFRELRSENAIRPVTPAPRRDPDLEALTLLDDIAQGRRPIDLSHTQEYVEWTNPDCTGELIRKLHSGHFSIQGYLDLHGCTVGEAEEKVDAFFAESLAKGLRCVKIIHGRGLRSLQGPRLKNALIKRLSGRYRKNVIAYVTARQCDGGLGALYVLLGKK